MHKKLSNSGEFFGIKEVEYLQKKTKYGLIEPYSKVLGTKPYPLCSNAFSHIRFSHSSLLVDFLVMYILIVVLIPKVSYLFPSNEVLLMRQILHQQQILRRKKLLPLMQQKCTIASSMG